MPLIVTGTVGIDTVYTPREHVEGVLGGSGVYFSAAASFFGPVRLVAVVGEDFPRKHLATLGKFPGVDATGLEIRQGAKTFRWGCKYLENMDHRETLFTELNVLEEMPPEIPESFKDSRYVFLANTHPAVQLELLANFPGRRLAVADTMDLWIERAPDELASLLERVDGLALNYDEAQQLTGKQNPVTAGRRILECGPRFVVVKKGEHGAVLVHRDGIAALPAYPTDSVIDPTGAGDVFAGGMMGYIAAEGGAGRAEDPSSFDLIRRSLAYGTVAASFKVESFSLARMTSLTRDELAGRFEEFARMMRVA